MALTDLKSDLSKFRKPIERPPIENQSVEVNRKSNLTPISDLSNRITSPTPLKETPVKSVVIPKLFDNTEKFKGETEPKPMTLEGKFLGETDPNKMSLESKFLGQTTPSNFDFSPEFTTPKLGSVDFFPNTNADGFTTKMEESRFNFSSLSSPKPMTLEGKFLGETDPNKMSLESKFLGETTPTNFTFTPQFTATTPSNFTFTPQFTATTPSNFTFTPQFTTPTLKIVDFIPNTDAKGFTAKMKRTRSQFVDINRGQNTFTERIKNSKLGLVNFFPNDDAQGFTKNFVDKTKSQFKGISADGKNFKSPKVTFSGDFGLSFLPGNKIKLEGSAADYYKNGNQKWKPGGKGYENRYVSIGDLLIRENSPSYLTKIYSQFNLQDDSFNPNTLFGFRQPFILRGIQRKGKNEPQKWGFGLDRFDGITGGIDLIRGGVLTSTERAYIDLERIGKFLLSPKGIAWSIMQVGMQRTNKFNKIWTPANLLIAVGGQHIGLKPKRHGLLPFDFKDKGRYERLTPIGGSKYKDKLEGLRNNAVVLGGLGIGSNIVPLEVQPGGPESVYGIGRTRIDTSTNTFSNPEKTYAEDEAMKQRGLPAFVQKYNPIFKTDEKGSVITKPLPSPIDNIETEKKTYGIEFGVITNNLGGSTIAADNDLKKLGLLNKIIQITSTYENFFVKDNFSRYVSDRSKQKYSPIFDVNEKFINFGFDKIDKGENKYGKLFDVGDGNVGSVYKGNGDEYKKLGLASISYDVGKTPQSGYEQLWESNNQSSQKLKEIFGGDEILNYKQIRNFADNTSITKDSHHDFRTKYKTDGTKTKKFEAEISADPGSLEDYYKDYNIETLLGLGNSDTTIGLMSSSSKATEDSEETKKGNFIDAEDLVRLIFETNYEKDNPKRIQFRGTVNSISETYTPNWTDIKYSGRAENAYIYDTFGRELNFGFRVYAYSAKELKPMWEKLSALGKMTMPSYVTGGYHGNITRFTLGTMYRNFPALISSLQYSIPEEFTWEIGYNIDSRGSNDKVNELPMGVDVTIGLKLLNHELHSSNATRIYDYHL